MDINKLCMGCMKEVEQVSGFCPYCGYKFGNGGNAGKRSGGTASNGTPGKAVEAYNKLYGLYSGFATNLLQNGLLIINGHGQTMNTNATVEWDIHKATQFYSYNQNSFGTCGVVA